MAVVAIVSEKENKNKMVLVKYNKQSLQFALEQNQ